MKLICVPDFVDQLEEWQKFYIDVFSISPAIAIGINPDLPIIVDGFDRLVVMMKGITYNQVLVAMKRNMSVNTSLGRHFDDDLDAEVTVNDRLPIIADYALLCRQGNDADVEHKSRSADKISEMGIKGMTLLERLILGLYNFWRKRAFGATDMHLDIRTVTLCSGSRYRDGTVPSVCLFDTGEVDIGWNKPSDAYSNFRVREVRLAESAHSVT